MKNRDMILSHLQSIEARIKLIRWEIESNSELSELEKKAKDLKFDGFVDCTPEIPDEFHESGLGFVNYVPLNNIFYPIGNEDTGWCKLHSAKSKVINLEICSSDLQWKGIEFPSSKQPLARVVLLNINSNSPCAVKLFKVVDSNNIFIDDLTLDSTSSIISLDYDQETTSVFMTFDVQHSSSITIQEIVILELPHQG
jgi:hypothetical protein